MSERLWSVDSSWQQRRTSGRSSWHNDFVQLSAWWSSWTILYMSFTTAAKSSLFDFICVGGSCLFALALSWPVCFSGQDPLRVAQLLQPETKGTWWWYQTSQPCPGCLLPLGCRTSVPAALSDAWGSTILDIAILLHHVPNSDLNLSSATCYKIINTHTHTFNGPLSGTTQVSRTRKVNQSGFYWSKRQWVAVASGISWAICKSASRSRQITMPAPHHSVFYRPDALPAAQPTASKHWRLNN